MDIDNDDDDEVPILVNMVDDDGDDDDDDAPQLVIVEDADDEVDQGQEPEAIVQGAAVPLKLPPCPVTILAGFLGSGKTTLIQYILQSPDHGKRIAVIENEFGGGVADGLSVESMIARDGANQSLTDLIELPNGCVCCTVKDNLVQTLENLLDKRQDLDYILIESSGMANPGPIASVFWLDDALESRLQLDGIVTLVDAHRIMHQLQETEEAAQQIAYADRLLLNKVDLVDEKKQEQVKLAIQAINSSAPINTTTFSQIPELGWILDSDSFGRAAKGIDESKVPSQAAYCMPVVEPTHKHTSAVGTVALNQLGTVDLKKLNAWLASLLWPNQDEEDRVLRARLESTDTVHHVTANNTDTMQLYRIKGILSVKLADLLDEDKAYVDSEDIDQRRYVVQAVYDTWEIHPASENLNWGPEEERRCKIIVIGRNLQREELQTGFQSCFIK